MKGSFSFEIEVNEEESWQKGIENVLEWRNISVITSVRVWSLDKDFQIAVLLQCRHTHLDYQWELQGGVLWDSCLF